MRICDWLGGLEHEFYDFPFSWEFHVFPSSQLTKSYFSER